MWRNDIMKYLNWHDEVVIKMGVANTLTITTRLKNNFIKENTVLFHLIMEN